MEDKQLNYYQPLPSLRRFPSLAPSEKDKNKKYDQSLPEIFSIPSCVSELKSGPIGNAGTVPFVWEQYPGMPKDESKEKMENQSPAIVPKLPDGRIREMGKHTSINLSGGKHSTEVSYGLHSVSNLKENDSEVESALDVMESQDSDTTEGDEVHSGATNTISRTEPFFLNGSFSGISDSDDSSSNKNRNFLLDPQTRDFMIDRFLPAAKAMMSEAPQYAPRKQPVVQEQTRPILKVVNRDNSSLRCGPNVDNEEEERMHGKMQPTTTDVDPRQLSTGSRAHECSSSAGSCCKNVNELVGSSLYRQLQGGGMPSPQHELLQPISYAKKPLSSHDYELPGYAYSKHRGAFRNPGEVENAEETGFNNNGKGPRTFEELLAGTKRNEEVDDVSPMIEKMLNGDYIQTVESPCTYSLGLNKQGLPNLNTDVPKDIEECKTMENTHPTDFLYKDVKYFLVEVKEENTKILAQIHVDNFCAPPSPDRSNLGRNFIKDSATTTKSEVFDNENNGLEGHQPLKYEDVEKPKGNYSNFVIPPPLPKPPSDSWLSRTLLSMGSRTPSSQEHISKGIHPGKHIS